MKFTNLLSNILKITCLIIIGLSFISSTSTSTSFSISSSNSNNLGTSKIYKALTTISKSSNLKALNSHRESYYRDNTIFDKHCRNVEISGKFKNILYVECQEYKESDSLRTYGEYDLNRCLKTRKNGSIWETGDRPFKQNCKYCGLKKDNGRIYMLCHCRGKENYKLEFDLIERKYGELKCGKPLKVERIQGEGKNKDKKTWELVKPKNFAKSEKLISEYCSEIKLDKNGHTLSARCGLKSPEENDKDLEYLSEVNLGECIGTDSKGKLREKFRGNYYKKCKDCKLSGLKLSCDCQFSKYKSEKGKFVNSEIDLEKILATDQGVLSRCGPLALRREELGKVELTKKENNGPEKEISILDFSDFKKKEKKISEFCTNIKLVDEFKHPFKKDYEKAYQGLALSCRNQSWFFKQRYELGNCIGKSEDGELIEEKDGSFYAGCRNCRLIGLILNCDCEDKTNKYRLKNSSIDLEKILIGDENGRLKNCGFFYGDKYYKEIGGDETLPPYRKKEDIKKEILKKQNEEKNKQKTISNSCNYIRLHKPHCPKCTSYEYFTAECKNASNAIIKSTVDLGQCIGIDDDGKLVNRDKGDFYKECKDCKLFGTYLMCNCKQDNAKYEYSMIDLNKILQIGADGNPIGCGPINPNDKNRNGKNAKGGNNGGNAGGISSADYKELKEDIKGIKEEMRKICKCVRKRSTDLLKSNQQERDTRTGRR